jgi:type VI secretion system protein ImpA
MTVDWAGEDLLQPIAPDQPCGENLEDTPLLASFDALRLFGESRSPEAPPDPEEQHRGRQPPEWGAIRSNALDALGRSRDLRLLAYLGAALLRTDGLPAFFRTLSIASAWLEQYWTAVYPLLDGDAVARRNALNCFADPMAVVERLRREPLVESRQHGKYSLRDIELAAGQGPAAGTDVVPQQAQIDAAFAEMPTDRLAALQGQAAEAIAALNRIDGRMRTEGGPEVAPSFDPLSAQLVRMNRVLRDKLAGRAGAAVPGDAASGAVLPGGVPGSAAGGVSGGVPGSAPVAVGAIGSRQDAVRVLEAVADYFRRTEPSSPVPLLIDRARRLVAKDFLEVLADLAPDALPGARAASGLKSDQ